MSAEIGQGDSAKPVSKLDAKAEGEAVAFLKNGATRLALHPDEAELLGRLLQAIRQTRFGYIQITLQDGHVVQIERTEKQRFNYKVREA